MRVRIRRTPSDATDVLLSTQGAPIAAGTTLPLSANESKKTELSSILFASSGERKANVRFTGVADHGPVRFHGKAVFHLKFKVGVF